MGMSEGFGGDDEALVSAINVTPLVDVMLVLLVIFMVTAPMLNQGVEVDLPRASTQSLQTDSQPVVVSLQKEGALFVGEESIALEDLPEKVAGELEKQGNPQGQVYVKADAALDYGEVMEVIGALHARGLTQVGLVTEAE